MSDYDDHIRQEAFGHIPTLPDRDRDETRIPLIFANRPDGVYCLDGKWRVLFKGAYRFEVFGLEQYDDATKLLRHLQAGGDL